jgi:hypothetical protein
MEENNEIQDDVPTVDELIEMYKAGELPDNELGFTCYLGEEDKRMKYTRWIHRDELKRAVIFNSTYNGILHRDLFNGIITRNV